MRTYPPFRLHQLVLYVDIAKTIKGNKATSIDGATKELASQGAVYNAGHVNRVIRAMEDELGLDRSSVAKWLIYRPEAEKRSLKASAPSAPSRGTGKQTAGRTCHVTEEGRKFLDYAEVCIEARLARTIARYEPPPLLRIATQHMFSSRLFPPVLQQLYDELGSDRFDLEVRDITDFPQGLQALADDLVDLVLDAPPEFPDRLLGVATTEDLATFERVLIIPRELLRSKSNPTGPLDLGKRQSIRSSDLAAAPLCYSLRNEDAEPLSDSAYSRVNLSSLDAVRRCVLASRRFVGVSLDWAEVLEGCTEQSDVTILRFDKSDKSLKLLCQEIRVLCAYRQRSGLTGNAERFVKLASERLAAAPRAP